MSAREQIPIGIMLWETTQLVTRAYDAVLAEHGGNRAVWFVFLTLDARTHTTQRELAEAIGIKDATLSHHLASLERRGLVVRRRDDRDRRVQRIEFTAEGREAFERMREAAIGFDRRLRADLGREGTASLLDQLTRLSERMRADDDRSVTPPID